jgi:uncharacterized membrane protein
VALGHDRATCGVSRWDAAIAILALVVCVTLFLAAPGTLLDKADRAAYAVCHRIGERSFYVAGRQLPLCARCSGTYLGALAGFIVLVLRGRGRAGLLPGKRFLAVLAVFLLVWAVDGTNSYMTLFPGLPHLYEPVNLLRLVTGTLEGLAIAAVMLPVVNMSLWSGTTGMPSIGKWMDLLWLLAGGAVVVVVVDASWDPLLYPLALLSGVMVVLMVGMVNALAWLLVARREGRLTTWRPLIVPVLGGLALAMLELAVIGIVREVITTNLNLPF